ncbi:MAG: glycosyltransferase family 2 protein [Rhodospirillaceae bacterium]
MSEQMDVIVRFHDARRLSELKRCVFSLTHQSYQPLCVILAVQRFSDSEIKSLRTALDELSDGYDLEIKIVNWEKPEPVDARSALLNLGIANAEGRYLAFLDYDDVMYPEAYETLISRLKTTDAAIVFASVRVMLLDVYEDFFYAAEQVTPGYRGSGLIDLLRNNFCPLHSYAIDRHKILNAELSFDTVRTMQEDYDLLLRICAKYASDFGLIGTQIGDYNYKSDGSNTVPTGGALSGEVLAQLEAVKTAMEVRRRTTAVSLDVQNSLGLSEAIEGATIRDVIDRVARGG